MFEQKCDVCKKEISPDEDGIHIMDENGFIHYFCSECGKDVKNKLIERDKSIKGR